MVAQETATVAMAGAVDTRQEALALTVALLSRMPLPLVPDQAADLAVCLFGEVLSQLSRSLPTTVPVQTNPCDDIG